MYRPRPETPLLFALALACMVACQPVPQPAPVPPQPPAEAGATNLPPEPATCAGACAREGAMSCPIDEDSPGGVHCPDVCAAHTMPGDRWDVACMAQATSCGQCKARK